MRKVQLYINEQLVDLFDDEKIEINSSIQNIQDISKVYTDFSQSFNLPASDNNNAIFDFFYNNDVDGTFQAQERADARIEINHSPFRKGQVQLEGSGIKRNEADSYKITFYGDIVTLKDLFGEDELLDLDYSTIATEYTGDIVKNSITNTSQTLDVRFPLISSSRPWNYGGTGSSDISIDAGRIAYTELFPAIKDAKLIDIIASEYGLTLNSNFLNSNYFNKSFTLWKNAILPSFSTSPAAIDFQGAGVPGSTILNNSKVLFSTWTGASTYWNKIAWAEVHIQIPSGNTNVDFFLDVYRNDYLSTTLTGTTTDTSSVEIIATPYIPDSAGLNDEYRFNIRVANTTPTEIYGTVYYKKQFNFIFGGTGLPSTGTQSYQAAFASAASPLVIPVTYDFNITAPKIKVADWFSGILKQFNLTCYPLEADKTYQIEPLEQWYNFGGEVNITPYTDIESIKVDRPKLYKSISFEWQDTKGYLNENFKSSFGRRYGDLTNIFPYDGKDFKVKLPFENMLFGKFTGTDLQVSYALDSEVSGKGYVPKPVKLFMDESKTVSFKFYNGSVISEITSYMPFGQDQVYNQSNYSQNFGYDVSSLKDEPISNSLYLTFFDPYIQNLFNPKSRKVTVKCHLPLPMLTLLTLDDAIILRDKKYRINSMKTDLTSGEVNLVLLSDFTETTGVIQDPKAALPFTGSSGSLSFPIKMLKPPNPTKRFGGGGYVVLSATVETSFITLAIKGSAVTLPLTLAADTILDITYARNVSGSQRLQNIPYTYYDASGTAISGINYLTITQAAL